MRTIRMTLLVLLVAGVCTPRADTQSPSSDEGPAGASARAADLTRERTLIDESTAASTGNDYVTARAKAAEAVAALLARPEVEQDGAWLSLLGLAGQSAWAAQDVQTANRAFRRVYEVRSATLPDEHPDLQVARQHFAATLSRLGDLVSARSARALFEKVLEVRSRTLPDEHPELQAARLGLAGTLYKLGDLAGAKAVMEKVLEVQSHTLPDEHPELQKARGNLAMVHKALGDLAAARVLEEKVLEVTSRTLPDEHQLLQSARGNLAYTLTVLGDLTRATALFEKVLEVRSRTLPDEHPHLQGARGNLALNLAAVGDLAGARVLQEKVLEVRSRMLADDHPELQLARGNLAATIKRQGDLFEARDLEEKVFEVHSRTLPPEHPALLLARARLAVTLSWMGDFARARALYEKGLEIRSRTLLGDHPDLQTARQNLALVIARQLARAGRSPGREGEGTGETEESAELVFAMCQAQVRAARTAILESPAREAEERCASLAKSLGVFSLSFAQGHGALEQQLFVLTETTRGAALASAELTRRAAHSQEYTDLRSAMREASEVLSGLAHHGATSEEIDRALMKRESVEQALVALSREFSGGSASGVEFDVASLAARLAEAEAAVSFRRYTKWWFEVADTLDSTGQPGLRFLSTDSLCAFVLRRAEDQEALQVIELGPIRPIEDAATDWLDRLRAASGRGLTQLAPRLSTKTTDEDRARAAAISLRQLVFDPLLPALDGVERLVVVMDDVLHAVPFDALPLTPPKSQDPVLLGDRYSIERRRTLLELLFPDHPPAGDDTLLALGGASFDARPLAPDAEDAAALENEAPTPSVASLLRGGAWNDGFTPLPETGPEARQIAEQFEEATGNAARALLLDNRKASRASIEALAPQARWLHLATHGWFAPESIRSWEDPGPLDHRSGLGARMSAEERIVGSSPMVLCGLALAGANLPADAIGRYPGLVTAEEMSTWDLTNCELAVLSACDTNVGVRRVGQGVASLQKALHMAGVRSVITSLWKVPDAATKELMLDFYRRLWVEKKPKHQALWEAKMKLRDVRDAEGAPTYSTRDWAGWVLTGDPD